MSYRRGMGVLGYIDIQQVAISFVSCLFRFWIREGKRGRGGNNGTYRDARNSVWKQNSHTLF